MALSKAHGPPGNGDLDRREHRLELHAGKDKIITRRPSLPFLPRNGSREKKEKRSEENLGLCMRLGKTSVLEVSIATLTHTELDGKRKDLSKF